MSRYRKVETRMWSDERFRALSRPAACGQALWFYLLTGPQTGPVPGLYRAGAASMAEDLDWSREDFVKAFAEVSDKGMAEADFDAKLVWIPKSIRFNKPESPNVVRSWRVELDLLPECELKRRAVLAIGSYLETMGEPYARAFAEVAPGRSRDPSTAPNKSSAKTMRKPSRKATPNQEQEQEQEQENTHTSDPGDGAAPGFAQVWSAYPRKASKAASKRAFEKRSPDAELLCTMLHAIERQCATDAWRAEGGRFIPHLDRWIREERWLDEPQNSQTAGLSGRGPARGRSRGEVEELARQHGMASWDELAERWDSYVRRVDERINATSVGGGA